MRDRASIAHDQANATSNLEVVQWSRLDNFISVRDNNSKSFRRLDSQQVRREHGAGSPFYLFAVLGISATLLQFCNVAILNAFWPFFTGIVVHLLAAMVQFARIILLPPEA